MMNLSYQLYNMMVFRKMKRMPTKDKGKENSLAHHKETKHHLHLYFKRIIMPKIVENSDEENNTLTE